MIAGLYRTNKSFVTTKHYGRYPISVKHLFTCNIKSIIYNVFQYIIHLIVEI